MSAFGNFGTTTAASGTGNSIFGAGQPQQQQQQQNQPSSLFGSTSSNPPFGGGLQQQQTQPQPQQQSSLFGSTTANPASGVQSQQPQQQSSLFGSSTTFGQTSQQQPQQQQQHPQQFGSTTTKSLFGTGTGPSLFGSTATNSLFGGGQQQQQQQQQQSQPQQSSLFGSSTANPPFGGGQSQQQQQQQQQPSLFGSTTPSLFGGGQQQPQQQSSLFGSTTTNPLFGQQQQQQPQQQQSSLFGSTTSNPLFGGTNKANLNQPTSGLTVSTLGAPPSLLTSRSAGTQQQQPADAQAQYQKLLQNIEGIYSAWNPQSKDCRFQYPFYNLVDPKQVNLYGRPANATNDAIWEKALKENPDPSCLVPVIAIGFDDLRTRVDAQSTQSASHLQKLKDIQSRLEALRTQHAVSNSSRIQRATALQIQLSQRVLHLVQHLHLLIPSVRSSALRSEEEALRGQLEEIDEDLRRGRIKGRFNELWALIGAVGAGSEGDWTVVDEEGLAQIAQILSEQQSGLQHLTKILQKDLKDLAVITGTKGSGSADDADVEMGGENLWSSTSTLRVSALR